MYVITRCDGLYWNGYGWSYSILLAEHYRSNVGAMRDAATLATRYEGITIVRANNALRWN